VGVDIKKLLIVEDDSPTRLLLQQVLEQAGYEVSVAGDGSDALNLLQRYGLPNLIIMDLGLPGMHGFVLSQQVKRMGDIPIIYVTGDSAEASVVYGLEQYADDYITKPFNVREVLARVQRVLSRLTDNITTAALITTIDGHLSIDFANGLVNRDGDEFPLTPIESSLLSILVRNAGRTVPSSVLIARTWPNEEVFEDTLRVHIHRLRQKVQSDSSFPYIRTERGIGYSFYFPGD
jgi:DNA-binding response OmpR family regulator